MRRPTAGASSTSAAPSCGCSIPASDRSEQLEIELPSHRTQAARKFVPAAEHLGAFHVHPAGHSVALDARGKLFSFALWEGAVRQHGDDRRRALRHGQWLADGATLVAVSDASGEERVAGLRRTAPRARCPGTSAASSRMRAAPRGRLVALANHRNEVMIGDLDSGDAHVIDRSDAGRTDDLAWSPDGAWLAYTSGRSLRHCAIKLHDVADRRSTLVTQPEFRDYSPAFDPDGRYLYFLSLRTFDPVYDSVQFELSFPARRAPVPDRAAGRRARRRSIRRPKA